jgi:ankyrin repeat protein
MDESQYDKLMSNVTADTAWREHKILKCIHGSTISLINQSIKFGKMDNVKKLISLGASIHYSGLFYCRADDDDMFQLLIEKGARINAQDNCGKTVLSKAVERGQYEYAKKLILAGANINSVDNNGETILTNRTSVSINKRRYIDFVKFVLSRPEVDIHIVDKNDRDAFFGAVYNHGCEMIELLIEKGANVNRTTKNGLNALAYTTNYNVIQILINAGICVNHVDMDGIPMIMHMIQKNHYSQNWLELLINHGLDTSYVDNKTGNTLLHEVAISVNDWCKVLIEKGNINIDSTNENGETALHLAMQAEWDTEIVHTLLKMGADINAQTNVINCL